MFKSADTAAIPSEEILINMGKISHGFNTSWQDNHNKSKQNTIVCISYGGIFHVGAKSIPWHVPKYFKFIDKYSYV